MKYQNALRGFTLIELLVVVLIIGILTSVAVPQYQIAVAKSRLAAIRPLLASIKQAEEAYYLTNGTYTGNIQDLDVDLTQCSNDTIYGDIKICGDFMIDILMKGTSPLINRIRAAYCPNEKNKKWDRCAYSTGEYVYNVWLTHSTYPDTHTCSVIGSSNLGAVVCKSLN